MATVEAGSTTMADIEMAAIEEPKESVPEKEAPGPSQGVPEPPSEVVAATPAPDDVTETLGVSRDHWTYNWEFIFAAVAYNVDAPIIYRFMNGSYRYGGVSFMMLYATFLMLIGVPMFFMELCLGQFFGRGPVHIWNFCPLFRGVGVAMVITIALIIPYYNTLVSWIFFYFFNSFSSTLPWASCDNSWNTEHCHVSVFNNYSYPRSSPAEEYFERRVLQISDSMGIDHLGSLQWELVGCAFAVTLLVFVVLFWGVKVIGKVLFVALLMRYVATFVLLVRAVTLPGATMGLKYYLIPSYRILNPQVLVEAFMLALFTSGVGFGAIHTLASYKKFRSTALRDSFMVCVISSGTCFFTGLVFHAFYGALDHFEGTHVMQRSLFPMVERIPDLLAKIPGFQYWSVLFFFTLLIPSISSQLLAVEVIITAIADILPRRTNMLRPLITAVVCCAAFIFSLPFLTKGGYYLFNLFDQHIAFLVFHVIIILECVTVGWIYGFLGYPGCADDLEKAYELLRSLSAQVLQEWIDQFSNDIQMMTGLRPSIIYKFLWCFIIPLFSLLALAFQLLNYYSPMVASYVYPTWAVVIGWIIALVPLVPLPVFILLAIATPGQLALAFQLLNYYSPMVASYVYPTWAVVIGWIIALVPLVPLPVFILLAIATPGQHTVTSNASWGPADTDYKMLYTSQIQRQRTALDRLKAIFRS